MTDDGLPIVTVLVPARNERKDIEGCLRSILGQDYPNERLDVVVVDGGSTDGTAAVVREVLASAPVPWQLLENPAGSTPSNLNAGLSAARGDYVCRVDARSCIPKHYVRTCVSLLSSRPEVAVVGGSQVAVPRGTGAVEIGIARALNNRFGMGLARYRSGGATGPGDTVYLGAFRTSDLRRAGGWDERMLSNQDYELNRRLGRLGLIWFQASIEVGYLPRRGLDELWSQYHRFGQWKVRYWRHSGDSPQPRQWFLFAVVPVATVGGALGVTAAWGRGYLSGPTVAGLVVAATSGALCVEAVGTRGPRGGPRARAVALASLVAIGTAWVGGIWREFLVGEG